MIVIFGLKNDQSTDLVTRWLQSYNKKCIVIENYEDMIKLDFNKISSVWFRKHQLTYQNLTNDYVIKEFLDKEYTIYLNYLDIGLKDFLKLGNGFSRMDLDKLHVLNIARFCKLNVPETLVSNSKKELLHFLEKEGVIITKPMSNPVRYNFQNQKKNMYTKIVTKNEILKLSNFFFPSLFQKYIIKKIELRIFFIDGSLYSCALIPELNKFQVDIRQNNNLRVLPFILPTKISTKLLKLMKKLELNTGSIDMIIDKDNNYYFLEVNPCGIYDGLSKDCNYNLDKKIANFLMN
jgi:hypothetical protein